MMSLAFRIRSAIVLFGDSITQQGFGWEGTDVGWASLLSRDYSRRADVLNRGFSGYNTRHAVDVLSNSIIVTQDDSDNNHNAQQRQKKHQQLQQQPILFATVFFGANDAASAGEPQHVSLEEYGQNLATIIKTMRSNWGFSASRDGEKEKITHDVSGAVGSTDGGKSSNKQCRQQNDLPIVLFTPPPVDEAAWCKEMQSWGDGRTSDRSNERAKLYVGIAKMMTRSVIE